jgi:hypothetical protein
MQDRIGISLGQETNGRREFRQRRDVMGYTPQTLRRPAYCGLALRAHGNWAKRPSAGAGSGIGPYQCRQGVADNGEKSVMKRSFVERLRAGLSPMGNWIAFWDSDHSIYVNERHRDVHYRTIAEDIRRYVPAGATVLDYGCGEALHADIVVADASRLIL